MSPFQFQQIVQLLEYLAGHSNEAATHALFSVKMTLEGEEDMPDAISDQLRQVSHVIADDIISVQFRCTVEGVEQVAHLFHDTPYRIQRISWGGQGHEVRIDCRSREVLIRTDSLIFLEICRHKMTGQGVRKMTVDLKIR